MKRKMRILIRKRASEYYLQPSGGWSTKRETAREFPSSVFAYWWAQEQELLGIEILLAFDYDPSYDFACLRL